MLEIVFDILEGNLYPIIHILYAHSFAVLRYLRFERHILHRDISQRNVLYVEDDLPSSTGARSGEDETVVPEGLPHCFNKYLLGERCVEVLHNWAYTNVTPNLFSLLALFNWEGLFKLHPTRVCLIYLQ